MCGICTRSKVALKWRETFVASPTGAVYVNRAGSVGLATSGSGEVLAGIIAGLMARSAEALRARAAAWGIYLHARSGKRAATSIGPLGFLTRELLLEIPKLMSELGEAFDERQQSP